MKKYVVIGLALVVVVAVSLTISRRSGRVVDEPTEGPLSRVALANATYRVDDIESGWVRLNDGKFEDAPAHVWVTMLDEIAYGDVTGDGKVDAALILALNTGGTGVFHSLVLVRDVDGEPVDAAAVSDLGDRIRLESFVVEDGEIVVEMIAHGPSDPMCCPTMRVTQMFTYVDGALEMRRQIPPADAD